MFEKILFPTDFSELAKTELNCITSIPGVREIILLHVIRQYGLRRGSEMAEGLQKKYSEVYLRDAKTCLAALNPDIRVTLEKTTSTDITGAILETAEEHGAGLIVIRANIKGLMKCVLLSCVSSTMLCRISKINLMIMPGKLVESMTGNTYEKYCPMIFSRILCPTNFSEFSVNSTILAGTTSGTGEIILLHVVPESEGMGGPAAVATAEDRIKAICDKLTAQGIRARTIVATGKPAVEIPRIAQAEDVSLIWMRSTAKGCLHDFFFGSMVHDIIMNATQPVMIIRSYQ